MATPRVTPFTAWNFSDDVEAISARILPPLAVMHIQNRMSELAIMRLNIKVDPKDVTAFIQTEASLAGAINELQGLLIDSMQAEQDLKSRNTTTES